MSLSVIILAAGQGSRMGAGVPKTLREVAGRPMLDWVLAALKPLKVDRTLVMVHPNAQSVKHHLEHTHPDVESIEQSQPLGTGHAVQEAIQYLDDQQQVLILLGDVPGVQSEDLQALIDQTGQGFGLLTTTVTDPNMLGRIVRDSKGQVLGVVEASEASLSEKNICEINTGVCLAPVHFLKQALPHIKPHASKGEYYLLDVLPQWLAEHSTLQVWHASGGDSLCGVNTPLECSRISRILQIRQAERWIQAGVHIEDVHRIDIRGNVKVESGAWIDANVVLSGDTSIASGARVGFGSYLFNTQVGPDVLIHPYSVCESVQLNRSAQVGPYAVIRSSKVGESTQLGSFVEVKRSDIGQSVKAKHLSYLGDAVIASQVNIGAGVITCNYDGANKHTTVIQTGAFVGAAVQLIAPVTVGKGAFVAAGATLRADAPEDGLTIEPRSKLKYVKRWKRPKKQP